METPVNAIAEYEPVAAALAGIEKYRGVLFDLTTAKGVQEAKAAQREVAAPRIALEKTRKKLKEDVLERGRLIDGEAKRIAARIAEIEDPIVDQLKAEERRIEAEREAAIKAEQERLAAEERARKEAEEKRLAEERAKIEAENKRLAEERAKLEAEDRARRAKIEEEERAARKRIEEAEAKARAERRAEEDRLRAAREKLEAEQRAKEEAERRARAEQEERQRQIRLAEEERQRKEREAREAAEREERRKQQELLDADEQLASFITRYGHMPRYSAVVETIRRYFDQQRKAA